MNQHRNFARRGPQTKEVEVKIPPVEYEMGHNGTHVLMQFRFKTSATIMALDDAGVDNLIKHLTHVRAEMKKAALNG